MQSLLELSISLRHTFAGSLNAGACTRSLPSVLGTQAVAQALPLCALFSTGSKQVPADLPIRLRVQPVRSSACGRHGSHVLWQLEQQPSSAVHVVQQYS